MSIQQFKKDLREKGQPKEREALALIRRHFDPTAYIIRGYSEAADICAPRIRKLFEVKNCTDALVCVPIEIHIENASGGKPSGLSVTKAHAWVIFCKGNFYIIGTKKLRSLVQNLPEKVYKIDDQSVTLKILSIKILEQNTDYLFPMRDEYVDNYRL